MPETKPLIERALEDLLEMRRENAILRLEIARLKRQLGARAPLTVEDLDMSVRSTNVLHSAGIKRADQLVTLTKRDLLMKRHFGRKSLREVRSALKTFGLSIAGEDNAQ